MLDAHGRKYVDNIIDYFADTLLSFRWTANQVTGIAFATGVSTALFIVLDAPVLAVIMLWISGLLDAVDGAMARKSNNTSSWGTLMDITFDRMVEMSVVLSLAWKYPEAKMSLLVLTVSILMSMTIFLTVGALVEQRGVESFYYQAGIAERTEGFILFSLMLLLSQWILGITNLFSLLVLITAIQRVLEAKRLLKEDR